MRSVADDLRRKRVADAAALSPRARIALALRLGDEDVALWAHATGVSVAVARARLADRRSTGRVASVANSPRRR